MSFFGVCLFLGNKESAISNCFTNNLAYYELFWTKKKNKSGEI